MGGVWAYFGVLLLITMISFIRKWNPLGKIIVLIYTVLAFFALFVPISGSLLYVDRLDESLVTYPKIVFLLISYVIFFSPFLQKNKTFSVKNLKYNLNHNYEIFAYFYILLGLFYMIIYSRHVVALLRGGDWAANRLLMLEDTAEYPDNNLIEKIAVLFVNYFQLLALIVSFLMLRDKKYKKTGIVLIIIICGCELCNDIYVSSRGMLAQFSILLLAFYFFFYPDVEKSNKYFINIMIVLLAITVGPYLAAVTISRFANQVNNSLVYYFGQTPYAFSLELNKIKELMYGRFAFGALLGDPKYLDAYGSWDHMFYTFVGWLYVDWGYVGVILIGIICSLSFRRIIRKKKLLVCDIYILLAYYKILVQGAFTIGRTKCYELIATFLIYIVLRFIVDKFVFVFGSKKNKQHHIISQM